MLASILKFSYPVLSVNREQNPGHYVLISFVIGVPLSPLAGDVTSARLTGAVGLMVDPFVVVGGLLLAGCFAAC